MSTKYDDAVTALYRAPLDQFVAERKRLSSELKAGGDKAAATRLAALGRPPISAWTVNQLWWEARDAFEELFAAGQRLRTGDLGATSVHRDTLTKLRAHAEKVLGAAGHAATEATLRRIVTDLSALAAVGSFDPDPPGALTGDREAPGFDVVDMAALESAPRADSPRASSGKKEEAHRERLEHEQRKVEERRKAEEERAKKRAERERIEALLRSARESLEKWTKAVVRLQDALASAEKSVTQKQADIADLESRLTALD